MTKSVPAGTLIFDIETHEADLIYTMPPEEFVRLIGYKWAGGSEVVITSDLSEIREKILGARWVIGHNILDFDLKAIFGPDSNVGMELADAGRVYDTWAHAVLVNPAPASYVNRYGKAAQAVKPEQMTAWFGLDEQAHQLGVVGKTHDLKELAYEFGPEGENKKERTRLGFGLIPVDDPRYVDYLKGDVLASEAVAKALRKKGPLDEYALREQRKQSRLAVISSNGIRVSRERAEARQAELAARKEEILKDLQENYGFPVEGKSPWATTEGKEAIFKRLQSLGITSKTVPDWPRTATGNLSLGGDTLKEITKGKGEEAESFALHLAELKGQRSLSKLALDSTHSDGFAHPGITMLQRSGRSSTTRPGLTVWTARGPGAIEKSYFVPDTPDEVFLEIDLSNADARNVAAVSGDRKYAERFEPGQDGHLLNAWAAWGKDVVGTDKSNPVTAAYRQKAKPLGHGWGYSGRPNTLSKQTGTPLEDCIAFVEGMDKTYRGVVAWQKKVRAEAHKFGYVTNMWGRKMVVEKGREFTQAPALIGQSMTAEIVWDGILKMSYGAVRTIKAMIHDALLFSVKRSQFEQAKAYLTDCMETTIYPKGGLRMHYPVDCGPAGDDWYLAGH